MDQPLGMVLKGFKAGCNKAFRELGYAATVLLQREPQRGGTQTKGAQTRKTGGAKARKAGSCKSVRGNTSRGGRRFHANNVCNSIVWRSILQTLTLISANDNVHFGIILLYKLTIFPDSYGRLSEKC
jgi:hypothetical protein